MKGTKKYSHIEFLVLSLCNYPGVSNLLKFSRNSSYGKQNISEYFLSKNIFIIISHLIISNLFLLKRSKS